MYIDPGSPRENGSYESFNSKKRDEFLNGEILCSMKERRVLAERWRKHYNTVRPHSSLDHRPPAPEAWMASTAPQPWEPFTPLMPPPDCHILHRSELEDRCATLIIQLVQKIGQAT